MGLDKTVDTYIEEHETWQSELTLLRKLAKSHNLEETIKWGRASVCFRRQEYSRDWCI